MVSTSSGGVQSTGFESEEFLDLLARARDGESDALGELLKWYFSYLTILATTQLDQRLRRRINPSDLVQETMLAAHRDFGDFRGTSQNELLGWLRQILIHTLHRTFAKHVKTGYLARSAFGYRGTLKGAMLMTWKELWPFKGIRQARMRRIAQQVLDEFEASGPRD